MGEGGGAVGILGKKVTHLGISRIEGMLSESFPSGKVDRGGHEKRMNQRFAKVKVFSLVFFEGA